MRFILSHTAKLSLGYVQNRKTFMKMSNQNSTLPTDLGKMRVECKEKENSFTEDQLIAKEPLAQFKNWYEEARTTPEITEPGAMCLATCTKSGIPSARYVLLRGYDKKGFKFHTNYNSRKGKEISENPNVALVFYWEPLKRSVRIEGIVEKLSEEESTEFFRSRSKDNQIWTVLSCQSQPIGGRNVLIEKETSLKKKYATYDALPKPEEWGGYIVKPQAIEFWQEQTDHLHDRIRYRFPRPHEVVDNVYLHQGNGGWVYERLEP